MSLKSYSFSHSINLMELVQSVDFYLFTGKFFIVILAERNLIVILPTFKCHNELSDLFGGEGLFKTQQDLFNLIGGAIDLFSHILKHGNFFSPFVFLLCNTWPSFQKKFPLLF